jgi:hypothetical protein
MPEKSILDARLAEIDRRLRTIQSELAPAAEAARAEREPRAPVIPPEAAPVPMRVADLPARPRAVEPSDRRGERPDSRGEPPDGREVAGLVARLTELVQAHQRLLASAREQAERREPIETGPSVSVSAGPFADTEALRRFEQALQTLPQVRRVAVREYEGADRAIVDVHLSEPTT